MSTWSKADCIKALQEAADELGHPPSRPEYKKSGKRPSATTITKKLGGWNAAKEAAGLEIPGVTEQECLDSLREAADRLGKSPSRSDYESLDISPCAKTVADKLGGWNAAKEAAGLETYRPADDRSYDEKDCIAALQEAARQLGHSPSQSEYRGLDIEPSARVVGATFGSWNTAKQAADLDTEPASDARETGKDACIEALKEVVRRLDKSPTAQEYENLDISPSVKAIINTFGSWNAAKEAAELEVNARTYTKDECREALLKVAAELGHSPSKSDYQALDQEISADAITNQFGGWNKAKRAVGLEVTEHVPDVSKRECEAALRKAAEKLGESPSIPQYAELEIRPSASTITEMFGSWNEAKEGVGLETNGYKREDCIEALQQAAKLLGHSPTQAEYRRLDLSPSASTICNRMGWTNAKKAAGLQPSRAAYSKQECIDALREAKEEIGRSPSRTEYRELDLTPSIQPIIDNFGGWNAAKEEAGLEVVQTQGDYSEQDYVESLLEAQRLLDHSPSRAEYRDLGLEPTAEAFEKRYGSWNSAKREAGLETQPATIEIDYTERDCIEALHEVAEEIGRSPSRNEYAELGLMPSASVITKTFDGWNAAKRAAGLEVVREFSYSKDECIQALLVAEEMLGHAPSESEYRELDLTPGLEAIKNTFGSWNAGKRAAGLEVWAPDDEITSTGRNRYGPNWDEIRVRVLKRDGFECQRCGQTAEEQFDHYGCGLTAHHIIRFGEFSHRKVANHTSNLIAVCSECHGKVESKPVEVQCRILGCDEPEVSPRMEAIQSELFSF